MKNLFFVFISIVAFSLSHTTCVFAQQNKELPQSYNAIYAEVGLIYVALHYDNVTSHYKKTDNNE